MSILTSKKIACAALAMSVCLTAGLTNLSAYDKEEDEKKAAAQKAVLELAGGKGDAKELAKVHAIDHVMRTFKLRTKGGVGIGEKPSAKDDGIEARIMALGRGRGPTAAELKKDNAALTKAIQITVAIGEISEHYAPKTAMGEKNAKNWKKHNDEMIKSGKDLIEALRKADPADVKKAAAKLNQSCNDCHGIFLVDS